MQSDTERFILDVLRAHNILTLATVREDGYPQATTVGYVHEGLTLYIGTFAHAQKVANIRRCPKVSLTIDRDYDDWSQIKGLSMGGRRKSSRTPRKSNGWSPSSPPSFRRSPRCRSPSTLRASSF
jgi:Pyridoxamine 5'-phosphate oxidase